MDNKQLKVLLIEGQQQAAEEIKKELLEQGFVVSVSLTTENGLLRALAHQFDLFVVNSGNDGKQGFNFANSLLKLEQYNNPGFIFVFSPKVKVDVRLRKFDHRFDIIRLPFDATELRIRMKNLLEQPVAKEVQSSENEKKKADDPVAHSGKVLLVEDNPLNQKVLGMFISRLGFDYDIASNGQMAVDSCKSLNYPFILMDIYMPGMDGTEATEKIRQLEEQSGHRAKIIAITANESEESVKRCYDSGMDDYLVKPFTLEVLKEKLV
jgi:DNA-binding response OmpR family regulator